MKKIINFFDKYFFEIVLTILAFMVFWNGYCNIGIWYDGSYKIFEGLSNNIRIDPSRFVPSFLLSLCNQIFNLIQTSNVKLFIKISSYWMYFITFIPLPLMYLLLLKKNRNFFVFPLLCYILSLIFSQYFITSELFLSSAFYWIIFLLILFNDFEKISIYKLFIILFFCLLLLSSYQSAMIYSLLLLLLLHNKTSNTLEKLSKGKQFILYSIYILLLLSTIFNFFTIFYPYFFEYCYINTNNNIITKIMHDVYTNATFNSSYTKFISDFFCSFHISLLFFCCFIFSILFVKNKYVLFILFCASIFIFYKFILFDALFFSHSYLYKTSVFFFTIFFSIYILIINKINRFNFIKCKFVIILLLCFYCSNTIFFGINTNKIFGMIYKDAMLEEKNIISEKEFFFNFNEDSKKMFVDKKVFPVCFFILQLLYSDNNKISKLILEDIDFPFNDIDKNIAIKKIKEIISNKSLKNKGIKFSSELLKDFENLNNDFKVNIEGAKI